MKLSRTNDTLFGNAKKRFGFTWFGPLNMLIVSLTRTTRTALAAANRTLGGQVEGGKA